MKAHLFKILHINLQRHKDMQAQLAECDIDKETIAAFVDKLEDLCTDSEETTANTWYTRYQPRKPDRANPELNEG